MAINLNKIIQITDNITVGTVKAIKKPSALPSDCVEFSSKNIVKVYNSLIKKMKCGEMLVSPEFNGCHGVGIASEGKVFFSHFPPFAKGRMKDSIQKALPEFQSGKETQVIFVSPVDSKMQQEDAFDDYLNLIREKIGDKIDVNVLSYPCRSKGKTYKYIGTMSENGKLINSLISVANQR